MTDQGKTIAETVKATAQAREHALAAELPYPTAAYC